MSGGKVDIAARQAWFEEQAAHAESEWIDSFQERFEYGDDVPDKEHFIALWLAERDPLATDLAAAIARAEAAEARGVMLTMGLRAAVTALAHASESDAIYTRTYEHASNALRDYAIDRAAIAAQQAEGESS